MNISWNLPFENYLLKMTDWTYIKDLKNKIKLSNLVLVPWHAYYTTYDI